MISQHWFCSLLQKERGLSVADKSPLNHHHSTLHDADSLVPKPAR